MEMRGFKPYLLAVVVLATALAAHRRKTSSAIPGRPARSHRSRRRRSPPPWSGQSGGSGDPTMTADAIRAAAADFHNCLARLRPACRPSRRQPASLHDLHRRADARSAHHGPARQPARVHQVVLGLSRHSGDRRSYRAGARAHRQVSRDLRRRRAPVTASTATPSPPSGAWRPITARKAATAR